MYSKTSKVFIFIHIICIISHLTFKFLNWKLAIFAIFQKMTLVNLRNLFVQNLISTFTSQYFHDGKAWCLSFLTHYQPLYMRPEAKLGNTKPDPTFVLWCFLYISNFKATRRFLEALKTAGESLDLPLQDPKMWSTFVDL